MVIQKGLLPGGWREVLVSVADRFRGNRYFRFQPSKRPRRDGLARLSWSILRTFAGRTTFGLRRVWPREASGVPRSAAALVGVAKTAWSSPVLIWTARPPICPRSFKVTATRRNKSGCVI